MANIGKKHSSDFKARAALAAVREEGKAAALRAGSGRYLANIFIERLWRSLKYEEVFIHAYVTVAEARSGIGKWVLFQNDERLHQALGYQTPREIFEAAPACGQKGNQLFRIKW